MNAITDFFVAKNAANWARVFNGFVNLPLNLAEIGKFLTDFLNSHQRMHKVGSEMPKDIIAYLILKELPSSMATIAQQITHSNLEITPKKVLEHFRIYADDAAVLGNREASIALLSNDNKKCKKHQHNPLANHPESRCWMLHPHLRPSQSKVTTAAVDTHVSAFHTKLSPMSSYFVLDSVASSYMTFNKQVFATLTTDHRGIVKTGSGEEKLAIKGTGTIRLKFKNQILTVKNFLYDPILTFNLLSVRCLILDGFDMSFGKNMFNIHKKDLVNLDGFYYNNLPCLKFVHEEEIYFLSYSSNLHKSSGYVSSSRIRQKRSIPIKPEVCDA